MPIETLLVFLDYDYCFYLPAPKNLPGQPPSKPSPRSSIHVSSPMGAIAAPLPAFTINLESPLIQHMLEQIKKHRPEKVVISSFSNYQYLRSELDNVIKGKTISSFLAFECFVKSLPRFLDENFSRLGCRPKVFLDKYLLVDSALTVSPEHKKPFIARGKSFSAWDDAMTYLALPHDKISSAAISVQDLFYEGTARDKYKLILFYLKAHRYCGTLTEAYLATNQVHAIVYEDDARLLACTHANYLPQPELLPKNYSVELFNYDPEHSSEIAVLGNIAGQGSINFNWQEFHRALLTEHFPIINETASEKKSDLVLQKENRVFELLAMQHRFWASKKHLAVKTNKNDSISIVPAECLGCSIAVRNIIDLLPAIPLISKNMLYEEIKDVIVANHCKQEMSQFQSQIIQDISSMIKVLEKTKLLGSLSPDEINRTSYCGFLVGIKKVLTGAAAASVDFQQLFDSLFFRTENYLWFLVYFDFGSSLTTELENLIFEKFNAWVEFLVRIVTRLVSRDRDSQIVNLSRSVKSANVDVDDKLSQFYTAAIKKIIFDAKVTEFLEPVSSPRASMDVSFEDELGNKISEIVASFKSKFHPKNIIFAESMLDNPERFIAYEKHSLVSSEKFGNEKFYWLVIQLSFSVIEGQWLNPDQYNPEWSARIREIFNRPKAVAKKADLNIFLNLMLAPNLKLTIFKSRVTTLRTSAEVFVQRIAVRELAQIFNITETIKRPSFSIDHTEMTAYHLKIGQELKSGANICSVISCEWLTDVLSDQRAVSLLDRVAAIRYQNNQGYGLFERAIRLKKGWGNALQKLATSQLAPYYFTSKQMIFCYSGISLNSESNAIDEMIVHIFPSDTARFPTRHAEGALSANISSLEEFGIMISGAQHSTALLVKKRRTPSETGPLINKYELEILYFNPQYEDFSYLAERTLLPYYKGAALVRLTISSNSPEDVKRELHQFVKHIVLSRFYSKDYKKLIISERALQVEIIYCDENVAVPAAAAASSEVWATRQSSDELHDVSLLDSEDD